MFCRYDTESGNDKRKCINGSKLKKNVFQLILPKTKKTIYRKYMQIEHVHVIYSIGDLQAAYMKKYKSIYNDN